VGRNNEYHKNLLLLLLQTFYVTRTQFIKDRALVTVLRQCWTVSSVVKLETVCQTGNCERCEKVETLMVCLKFRSAHTAERGQVTLWKEVRSHKRKRSGHTEVVTTRISTDDDVTLKALLWADTC